MLQWVLASKTDAIGPFPTEGDARLHWLCLSESIQAVYSVVPLFGVGEG